MMTKLDVVQHDNSRQRHQKIKIIHVKVLQVTA